VKPCAYSLGRPVSQKPVPSSKTCPFSYSEYAFGRIPEEVKAEWETCNRRWTSYPFESMPWFDVLGRCNSREIDLRLMVATDSSSRCVCFWPYAVQQWRSGGVLPIRLCRPWSEDIRVSASAIVSPELDEAECTCIVNEYFYRLPTWDKMILGLTLSPSPLLDAMVAAVRSQGLTLEQEIISFAEIRGHASFQSFLSSLSRDWRRKYKRIIQTAAANGLVRIEHLDGEQTLPRIEMIKRRVRNIYAETWKYRSADAYANLAREDTFDFFSKFIESFARRGALHTVFVTLNGDDAAFYLGVHCGDKYCSVQTGYKEKYASSSVGFLAQMENFRYTIERGYKVNNLMGSQSYKRHFTSSEVRFATCILFNRNFRGTAARVLSRLKVLFASLHCSRETDRVR
jgi:hypothetical protein